MKKAVFGLIVEFVVMVVVLALLTAVPIWLYTQNRRFVWGAILIAVGIAIQCFARGWGPAIARRVLGYFKDDGDDEADWGD